MRVVCPHAGSVHPETRAILDRWPAGVEYVDLSGDDYAYARLLRRLWADAEDFLIVEHDVGVTHPALAQMLVCPDVYCCGVYPWTTCVGPALGFTRFRSLLMRTHPDVMEIASRIPSNYGEPGFWKQMDVWVQAAVLRDHLHVQPCVHLPPLEHFNEAQAAPADAPLVTRVQGRTYLADGLVERLAAQVKAEHAPTD